VWKLYQPGTHYDALEGFIENSFLYLVVLFSSRVFRITQVVIQSFCSTLHLSTDLKCKDGSSIVLKHVLFVPKLDANFLSARCLCEAGLVGSFNSGKMYFKLNGKTVIKATMENGLYIANHVSGCYRETAFLSIDYDMSNLNEKEFPEHRSSSQSSGLNQSAKDRCLLFYRCLAHLGRKTISKLYTMATLD
jgi:hypothetical protein